MLKKLVVLAMAFAGIFAASAQQPQLTPLPLNPEVKHGTLPNGLNYYILHNEYPKERANFYIAQKVGSTLETPEQLGLAHFLEHMAFNGTKNYPGKNMLNYLQSKGIRFGQDINAYTAFDETVYNINNVPTTDQALMDSVLLVLHDWSGSLLLEDAEIEAERGVIQGEWRSRNDANTRMFTAILPQIFEEYQYGQMPIGTMDVVMNFPPDVLRDYYHKWYHTDQQGIIVAGDFDVDAMEKKVIELFSTIPAPEVPTPRTYPAVSDNEKPIYATFEDPEFQNPIIRVAFKYDKTPFELRNTVEAYLQDQVMLNLVATMINTRLSEYAEKPECKYSYAGVGFGDFYVAKTKGAFNIIIVAKDDVVAAFNEAMAIVARACKTGFTDGELSRARDTMIAGYEKAYNERATTNTDARAKEIIRHFIDNEPAPGIEQELELVKQVLPMLPVQAMNATVQQLLTPQNQVIVLCQPQKEGMTLPQEQVMVDALNNAINAQYEAYVDEVITEPLIAKLPKPGKVKSESSDADYGTTEFTLSNGAKVVLKSTDFKADEILFTAVAKGGKISFPASQADNVKVASMAYEAAKIGPFNSSMLRKYLAGKNVSLGFEFGNYTSYLEGMSNTKDLKTLMELVYASFTNLGKDPETYQAMSSQLSSMLANVSSDPQFIFKEQVSKTIYGNNPMLDELTASTINNANYDEMIALIQNALSNAADFTFIFTGNLDAATLRPLMEQYIATLPSKKKAGEVKDITSLNMVDGVVENNFETPMQTLAVNVFNTYHDSMPFSIDNDVKMTLAADVLDDIYTSTLREEIGGTYGASVWGYVNPNNNNWIIGYTYQTNHKQAQEMEDRAIKEMNDLLRDGAKPELFNKAREAMMKQYEIRIRTNSYWKNALISRMRGINTHVGYKEAIENVTVDSLNAFMKTLNTKANHVEVVQSGVEAK